MAEQDLSYEGILKKAKEFYADPGNIPQYYTDPTVAGFSPEQLKGFQSQLDIADNLLAPGARTAWDQNMAILRGDDALTQQLAKEGAATALSPFIGAGTGTSARALRSSTGAAQRNILDRQRQARGDISNLTQTLMQPGNIYRDIGQQKRNFDQEMINADRARFEYAQLAPEQQLQALLGVADLEKAPGVAASGIYGSGGGGIGGNLHSIISQIIGSQGGGGGGGGLGDIFGGIGSAIGSIFG